jgi:hypothetical protein
MHITTELKRVLDSIEPGFFGTVEIGVQNGIPGHAKVTKTFKLSDSSRESSANGNRTSNSK